MAEIPKCEAIDFAVSVKKMIDALVAEGFDEYEAKEFVKQIYIAIASKKTSFI